MNRNENQLFSNRKQEKVSKNLQIKRKSVILQPKY